MDDPRRRSKAERLARKRELEEELRAIQVQKQCIEERQSVLEKIVKEQQAAREAAAAQAAARAAEAAAAAAAAAAAVQKQKDRAAQQQRDLANGVKDGKLGNKRTFPEAPIPPSQKVPVLSPQEAYDTKSKQVEADRAKRMGVIWSQCTTMLKSLKKMTHSWPFHNPVDPVKLNIPDYFNIVKKPMDLGTIEKKLQHNPAKNQSREYNHPFEFRDDVRQVWENCRLYNRPGQDVRKMGDRLSDSFEKKWAASDIEKKLKEEKAIQTREELELAELEGQITGGRVPGDYAKKLRKLNEELEAELADKDPDFKRASDGKMSFEQKRRISLALGALPGDKLYRVLEIVSESIKDCGDEDEEVELDIDALDDDTLRKLQDFVDSVLPSHSVPKNNPSSKSAGGSKDTPGRVPHTATGSKAPQHTAAKAPSRPPPTAGENGGTGEDGDKDSGSDSSSSSSGGSSSSSGSDSDGGEQRGSTYNAGDGATGGNKAAKAGGDAMEASALVSVTGPHGSSQPSILKHQSSKKEVNLQNANAWASLAGNQGETGEGGADNKEEGGKGDDLWSEFTAREQQQRRREQERRDEERQLERAKAKREEEERAKVERARAAAAKEEEERRRKDEQAEAESRKAREEERAKELAKLTDMGKGAEDLAVAGEDEDEKIKPVGGSLSAMFGFKMRDHAEDEDEDMGGDDDGEQEDDMEDGEVI